MQLSVLSAVEGGAMAFQAEQERLERAELEAPDCQASASVYAQLMLIYCLQNDLFQAKLLWKRLSEETKREHAELAQIWTVVKALIQGDGPAAFRALNPTPALPTYTQDLAQKLIANLRASNMEAVARSYASISLSQFAVMVGLTEEAALALALSQSGWRHDPTEGALYPQEPPRSALSQTPSQAQLRQLTNFMSFLEKQ
ncbi:hypothetical protein TCAL_02258 [Tigriopus californicus]|uniref:CSN8/PSMD8/EIF3K domain-containing protein n=1 Tax=Tigriopus californicus TaxID=6832 RepID=A0A553PQI0_TIGCA|nr:COP9 signalosome complex subunit 8-like [Tigriopus californicus]TRY79939.1 hypothetical protein TCAL_02258 [Tigriopus californicus]|eukprot:TCALIF_02258-PA protein Name:"Similar to csn8 COP9 signalosome complex subunit 8 (Xenopus laevis)" AED:0.01 eAED:0.01 QI:146/1/1/1/1/1/4/16/199